MLLLRKETTGRLENVSSYEPGKAAQSYKTPPSESTRSFRLECGRSRVDATRIISVIDAESKSKPVPFCYGLFRGGLAIGALYQRKGPSSQKRFCVCLNNGLC